MFGHKQDSCPKTWSRVSEHARLRKWFVSHIGEDCCKQRGHVWLQSDLQPREAELGAGVANDVAKSEPSVRCQTPYYVLQWVAVAKQRDAAAHRKQGARVGPPNIRQLYMLVIANMFSQILVFVSSCCNPIIYEPVSPFASFRHQAVRRATYILCRVGCETSAQSTSTLLIH